MSKLIHSLYDWMVAWAHHPQGVWALFILSFLESSFFPLPPDVLLIALCIGRPDLSLWFALACTVGSVLGAFLGYGIGWGLMDTVGIRVMKFYRLEKYFEIVKKKYEQNAFVAILMAGLTPIPYKVFTIAAGACRIRLGPLTLASIIGRGGRFFMVGILVYYYGEAIGTFIDKHLTKLSILFFLLVAAGFFAIKFLGGKGSSPPAKENHQELGSEKG